MVRCYKTMDRHRDPGVIRYPSRMNWKALVLAALVGFGLYQHRQQQPVHRGEGVVSPAAPVQGNTQAAGFQFKGYEFPARTSSAPAPTCT